VARSALGPELWLCLRVERAGRTGGDATQETVRVEESLCDQQLGSFPCLRGRAGDLLVTAIGRVRRNEGRLRALVRE
jgi:hypothetical protein